MPDLTAIPAPQRATEVAVATFTVAQDGAAGGTWALEPAGAVLGFALNRRKSDLLAPGRRPEDVRGLEAVGNDYASSTMGWFDGASPVVPLRDGASVTVQLRSASQPRSIRIRSANGPVKAGDVVRLLALTR